MRRNRRSIRQLSSKLTCTLLLPALMASSMAAACAGEQADKNVNAMPAPATSRTPTYSFEVVRTYPHAVDAYTQGLLFHEGRLFEGTGQYGESDIREVELESGRVIRKHELSDSSYFGEGIVIVDDKLIEITWKSGVAFIYDWKTFDPKGQFKYEGEGWGLTWDGTSIVMSNGSPTIVFRDPKTFAATRTIEVNDNGTPVTKLNELEWVKGEIWANVYQTDQIVRINPADGKVVGWIDLAGILPAVDRTAKTEVMNGILYDAKADRLFVTGKYWPKMFEIKLKQRS